MKNIDFLPDWYVESLRERGSAAGHVAGLLVVVALVVVWCLDSIGQTRACTVKLEALRRSSETQGQMIVQLDRLTRESVMNLTNKNIIADVGGGIAASEVLAELSHLMPVALSIRELILEKAPRIDDKIEDKTTGGGVPPVETKPKAKPKPTTLEIAGWAASGAEIGSFVRRLGGSPLFNDVTLSYERPHDVYGRKVVAFNVTCTMPHFE